MRYGIDRTCYRKIGLAGACRPNSKRQIIVANARQIGPLVRTSCAHEFTSRLDFELTAVVLSCFRFGGHVCMLTIIHDGLLQAHMHALTIHLFTTGQLKKGTNDVQANLRGARITGHSEAISSAGDIDIEAAFYLPQVLIKLAAKIGKAVIIGGFQDDVLRYLYGVQSLEFRPHSIDGSKPTSKAPHMEYFSPQIN